MQTRASLVFSGTTASTTGQGHVGKLRFPEPKCHAQKLGLWGRVGWDDPGRGGVYLEEEGRFKRKDERLSWG